MKKMIIIIALILLLVLGILLLASALKNKSPAAGAPDEPLVPVPEVDVPIDGGRKSDTDKNASKKIESNDLVTFYLNCSPADLDDPDLDARRYRFKARLEDGKVTGENAVADDSGWKEEPFTAGKGFMDKLNDIIKSYDLPSLNGIHEQTIGIPDDYGTDLEVLYSSGEEILADDNSCCLIPAEALKEIVQLFAEAGAQ